MKFLDSVVILLVVCTLVVLAKDGRKDLKVVERTKRNVNNGFPDTRVYNGGNNLFNYGPEGGYGYSGNYHPNGNVNLGRSALFDQYGNVIDPNYNTRRPIGANYNLVNPSTVPIYSNFNGYTVPESLGGNYPYGNGDVNGENYNLGGYNRRPNYDLNVGNINVPGLMDGNYRNFGFVQGPNYNPVNGFNGDGGIGVGQGLRNNLPENSNLYQDGFNSYPGLIQRNNDFSGIDPNSGLIARGAINGQNSDLNIGRTGLMDEKKVNFNNGGVGEGNKNQTVADKGAFLGEKVI